MADTIRDLMYGAALRGQMPTPPMPLPDTVQRLAMAQGGTVGTPYRSTLAEMVGKGGTMAQRLADAMDQFAINNHARISLKDLTLGDAGQVLEDWSYGMPPKTGGNYATGGVGTLGADPKAMDLFNLGGVAGGTAKGAQYGAKVLGPTLKEMIRKGIEKNMRMTGGLQDLITYHGSPHTFDRFDSSKIGTGEGAQAYGYGLYLAESPGVAQSYKEALGAGRGISDADTIARVLDAVGGDPIKAAEALAQRAQYANISGGRERLLSLAEQVRAGFDPRGSLYKVDLPDSMIERMLSYDNFLSEQHPAIRSAVANSDPIKNLSGQIVAGQGAASHMDPLGADIINMLQARTGPDTAAKTLRQRGIPGIRYLDEKSRAAGAGTQNFVVFPGEESALTILERNGRPLR